MTQGVARRLALPWAVFVRACSPPQSGNRALTEEIALAGKFFVPKEQKVADPGQEQLLLHATEEVREEPRTTRTTRKAAA